MTLQIKPAHWVVLGALTVMWGSSYMLIALALRGFTPLQVAAGRLLLGAAAMYVALLLSKQSLPRDKTRWLYFLAIAFIGNCIPFTLIAWGQQHVDSGLASILVAMTPLWVVVIAHFALPEGRIGLRQLAGFVLGFLGVVVLIGPDSLLALGGKSSSFIYEMAIVGAAIGYAISSVLTAKIPETNPIVTTTAVLTLSTAMTVPLALLDAPLPDPATVQEPLAALVILGVVGTALTTILYFWLVRGAGPRFASLFNYLIPLWAVWLGVVVLDEELTASIIIALVLILGGVILTQNPKGGEETVSGSD